MSTTLDGGHGDRHPRLRRAADWTGHRWVVLFVAGLGTSIPIGLFPKHDWIGTAVGDAWLLMFAVILLLGVFHDSRLCEQCATAMPLDGSAEAERQRRRLRIFHAGKGFAATGVYIALLTAPLVLPHGGSRMVAKLAFLPLIAAYWVVQRTHRRLYPWCPWCHWGGGGDGMHEPSPDPSIFTPTPGPV